MTYTAEEFPGFGGGLNLRDKADAIDPSQCIDALNVEFTDRGSVKQRDGIGSFAAALSEPAYSMAPYYKTDGTRQLLVGGATRLDALNTVATGVGSMTGLTGSSLAFAFVRFAAPGSEYAYASNGTNTLRRWDGASWTAPTATVDATPGLAMPKPTAMAVMPTSNRLVAGGFTTTSAGPAGATTNPSTVFFSGDTTAISPQNWLSTNFLQLTPGDGEMIQAMIAWGNNVYVFKETKFFVIYGESTASDGSSIFNYRTVDAGVGALSQQAVCANDDGVYFTSRKGVYRTTGQTPELISDLIRPVFSGETMPFFTGPALYTSGTAAMCAHDHKIFVVLPFNVGNVAAGRPFVYDTRFGTWTFYDLQIALSVCEFRSVSAIIPVLLFNAGTSYIYQHSPGYTNDTYGGVAAVINSKWRSGFQDFGLSDDKVIRETKMWGSGKASLAISKDFDTAVGTANLVDMTPSSAVLKGKLSRYAVRGTVFSTSFSNSTLNQAWEVHRLSHNLREQRIESVVSA